MNKEFQRESVYRHRSERLIDRILFRVEKKHVEDLKQKLQEIEKRKSMQKGHKRVKLDTDGADAISEEQKRQKELREKYAKVDHFGALCKIMKHLLTSPAKFSKCLSLTYELIKESFDFLTLVPQTSIDEDLQTTGNVLFNAFDAIMRCENKFMQAQDRETIEKLYLFIIELSESEEGGLFSEEQEKILDLYYIPVYVQSQLQTDDSFKFNETVKEVIEMLESLDFYTKQSDQNQEICLSKQAILEKCFTMIEKEEGAGDSKEESKLPWQPQTQNQRPSIYDEVFQSFTDPETQFAAFLSGIKRRLFFQTLKTIYGFSKHPWAKLTVQQTLKTVYLQKDRFNEEEQEQIEEMISALNQKNSQMMKQSQNREFMDSKIKSDPLQAGSKIQDARAERVVYEDGQAKWGSKQIGLTFADNK